MSKFSPYLELRKWGNSQGVRLPKEILIQMGVTSEEETQFEIEIVGTSLVLTKHGEESPIPKIIEILESKEEEKEPVQFEYTELEVDSRTFGENYVVLGKEYYDLMSALQYAGRDGWDLAIKESDTKYILKRQII